MVLVFITDMAEGLTMDNIDFSPLLSRLQEELDSLDRAIALLETEIGGREPLRPLHQRRSLHMSQHRRRLLGQAQRRISTIHRIPLV